MPDATIDVKSVCRNSGSARSKKYCGSRHRLKHGMSVILGMIQFPAGLLLSVDNPNCKYFTLIVLVMIFCSLISVSEQFLLFFTDFLSYGLPHGPV